VVGADAGGGEVEGGAVLGGDLGHFGGDFGGGEGERFRCQRQAVEALGQVDDGLIATRPDIGDDLGDCLVDVFRLFALLTKQRLEGGFETGIGGVQEDGHLGPPARWGANSAGGRKSQAGCRGRCLRRNRDGAFEGSGPEFSKTPERRSIVRRNLA
jgi:hypothetical protein